MDDHTVLPRVELHYCQRCRFVLRAGWLAQELLFSLGDHLGEVALVPGDKGVFKVAVNGETLFDKALTSRFPEAAELKRLVRDFVGANRDLGHSE